MANALEWGGQSGFASLELGSEQLAGVEVSDGQR